ncbi:MAG: hypothetical protein NTU80_07960 [Verrucomicrobia bacterium]|nr:hypothetical protein [Verrucomicrobiota bacterium]
MKPLSKLPVNVIKHAGVVLFLIFAATGKAAIEIDPVSWGLTPGATFRLVVVTNGTTAATSSNVAFYDNFVNTQGLSGITYRGGALSWQAIAGTATSNPASDGTRYSASANATPIYNLAGLAVSTTTAGQQFWRTSGYNQHLNTMDRTIDGGGNLASVGGSAYVWTGYDWDGAPGTANNYGGAPFYMSMGTVSATLGTSASYQKLTYDSQTFQPNGTISSTLYPLYGRTGATANGWSAAGDDLPLETVQRMFAMSELITVTAIPEPANYGTLAILFTGGAVALRRRRPVD